MAKEQDEEPFNFFNVVIKQEVDLPDYRSDDGGEYEYEFDLSLVKSEPLEDTQETLAEPQYFRLKLQKDGRFDPKQSAAEIFSEINAGLKLRDRNESDKKDDVRYTKKKVASISATRADVFKRISHNRSLLKSHQGNAVNSRFDFGRRLSRYKKTETKSGAKRFRCNECRKSFRRKAYLKTHLIVHAEKEPYTCNECQRDFTAKLSLRRHLECVHFGEKRFICHKCQKAFHRKNGLNDHMMRLHSGEKPYECDICQKCFSTKCNIRVHMLIHLDEKPWKCQECDKCFSRSNDLRRHSRTHSGYKPYKCDECEKEFARGDHLKNHARIHLKVIKPRGYECNECKKRFLKRERLKQHLKTHSKKYCWKCDECEKLFSLKSSLKRHKIVHSKDKDLIEDKNKGQKRFSRNSF